MDEKNIPSDARSKSAEGDPNRYLMLDFIIRASKVGTLDFTHDVRQLTPGHFAAAFADCLLEGLVQSEIGKIPRPTDKGFLAHYACKTLSSERAIGTIGGDVDCG